MKFSVAMSVYKNDNAIFFDRALESITYLQTVKPSEINLVVDGPIPIVLEEVISKYKKNFKNLKVIRLAKNGGLGKALKIAVDASNFELVARMDSDDVSLRTRFEEQIAFFQKNPNVDVVGGNITEFMGDELNFIAKREVPCTDIEIKEYIKKRCPFNHVTVMYKKRAVQDAGGYKEWFWNEDYYLWIRMLKKSSVFRNTGTVLVNVRVGKDMYERRGGFKYFKSEAAIQKYMLMNNVINFPRYLVNVSIRFVVQCMITNGLRGWIYKTMAREH